MIDRPYHYDMPKVALAGKSELAIQSLIRSRIVNLFPAVYCAAIPSAGKRTVWEQRQRKAEGMVSGLPDLMLMWPRTVAFIEVKAGSAVSDSQHEFLSRASRMGIPCGVFRSPDTFEVWLRAQGAPSIGRVAA